MTGDRIDPATGRCRVCGHTGRHYVMNEWRCDECRGPCRAPEPTREDTMTTTPTSDAGLRSLDHLPPVEAVRRAWTDPGARPDWHAQMREQVRRQMPLLARALDRLAAER